MFSHINKQERRKRKTWIPFVSDEDKPDVGKFYEVHLLREMVSMVGILM